MCALGHVRLTLVTNTHGAKTDSTAKEQQNERENALADRFRASHKHHDTHDLPLKAIYELEGSQAVEFELQLLQSNAAPRLIPLQQSNKKQVRKRLRTDFEQHTGNSREHITYL